MAMTIITISFVLVVLIYGKSLLYTVVGGIVENYTITLVWTYTRWPFATLLYFLLVLYNYFVMPVEKMKVKDLLPGTIFGAFVGTSTVTSYVESSAGVAAGGRTGLTAVTSAVMFIVALFFSPVFLAIPGFATTPALMYVGLLMVS